MSTLHDTSVDETSSLDFLSRLVQIKSLSETDGEKEITEFLVQQMIDLGIDANIYPFNDSRRQNAIGRWKGSGGGESLLFNGHVDTNPVTEGWTMDPWGGVYDESFIYGIGVSNMKAGCAAYFWAVKELIKIGWKPKGDVVLTFVVGELQGGVGTAAAISQGLMAANYFINCEPTDIRAITMHAESLIFEIELIGKTRHMSAREEAVDAILAACQLIPKLTDMQFSNPRSDLHRSINRCHVGIVHGALGRDLLEWRAPQVADFVRLRGAARFAPGQTKESVLQDIRDAVTEFCEKEFSGLQGTVKTKDSLTMPAFEVDPKSAIVQKLNSAHFKMKGCAQPTGVLRPSCFYGSDAGHLYKSLRMEGVVCGPGGRYNTRPDERVDICDYIDCIRMFMQVIVDVCG